MTTLLAIFLISLSVSLILTPVVARVGMRFGLVDRPSARKVHKKPVPRIGGIALFLAFHIPFTGIFFYQTRILDNITTSPSLLWLLGGSTLVFLMGLVDDVKGGLHPRLKLCIQIVAAVMAYFAGLRFTSLALPWDSAIALGWLSLPTTILWFLLVVNGINFIDGLDGLAAGVSLFASITLLALSLISECYFVAIGLTALVGACLGFLRYNFNPASIFMGDCGGYFLGYMLAALSFLGSVQSQATVAILIPLIALGLPLMDTILAPLRRFLLGQSPFLPDRNHIHHKLLQMGLSHRKAVLVMYFITVLLGFAALLMVNIRDERAGLILAILGVCMILGIRKLGYFEYLASTTLKSYILDVSDEMGFKRDRRTFLSRQVAIGEARDASELWDRIVDAITPLQFDFAKLQFNGVCFEIPPPNNHYVYAGRDIEKSPGACRHSIMSLELPLVDESKSYGTLHLKKDLLITPISHYTLRRIEHLRRSVVAKLKELDSLGLPPSKNAATVGAHTTPKTAPTVPTHQVDPTRSIHSAEAMDVAPTSLKSKNGAGRTGDKLLAQANTGKNKRNGTVAMPLGHNQG